MRRVLRRWKRKRLTPHPHAHLPADTSSPSQPRQIELPSEDIDATGCFLEYLYTGEYFPRKLPGQRVLEEDPSTPKVDDTGDQLLKHARVYTIAEKFGMPGLRSLSSSKIHCVNSTAKGEIAYARYVYQFTSKEDTTIRAPVASFWAARSHTLRSEAEDEFKALCLEFPQFGYDILSVPLSILFQMFSANLLLSSPRPRREAQARAFRKDAPLLRGRRFRPQARSPQRWCCRVDGVHLLLLSFVFRCGPSLQPIPGDKLWGFYAGMYIIALRYGLYCLGCAWKKIRIGQIERRLCMSMAA